MIFRVFFPSFCIPEYIQSKFAFASTIYSRSVWQRESRFQLWNTWLCFRGPSGLGTRLSCTKTSIQINYIISCRRMTKLGTLSDDDDDDNSNNVKKQLVLWAKQLLCTCITLFSAFLWRPLHDYDVKRPNATLYGGLGHTTTNFPFAIWTWIKPLRIQLHEKSPTFDELSGSK